MKEYGPTPFAVSFHAQAEMSSFTPAPSQAFAVPEAQQSKSINTSLGSSSSKVWIALHFTVGGLDFLLFCQLQSQQLANFPYMPYVM